MTRQQPWCPALDGPMDCSCDDESTLVAVDYGYQNGGVVDMCASCYAHEREEAEHKGCNRCIPEEVCPMPVPSGGGAS